MPTATTPVKWDLASGTWEQAESYLDKQLEVTTGADEVTRADVRRRLEVFGFDSPLNTDDEVGRAHGYRAAPALTTMALTWCMPAYWKPGDGPITEDSPSLFPPFSIVKVPAPGDSAFATDFSAEYHEPVYPGDRITSTSVLVEIVRKRTAVGDGAFFTVETTHTTQTGAVVSVERLRVFRYQSDRTRPQDVPAVENGVR